MPDHMIAGGIPDSLYVYGVMVQPPPPHLVLAYPQLELGLPWCTRSVTPPVPQPALLPVPPCTPRHPFSQESQHPFRAHINLHVTPQPLPVWAWHTTVT